MLTKLDFFVYMFERYGVESLVADGCKFSFSLRDMKNLLNET